MDFILNSPQNDDDTFETIVNNKNAEKVLGRGSYGVVLKAIYKNQKVAVKFIEKTNQIKFESVNNEANITGWKHNNIIRVFQMYVSTKYAVIVMERITGICLQLLIDIMKIPLYHQICICQDIVNGLSYCHKMGFIHLDVKPTNILISFDFANIFELKTTELNRFYICKICDFGCSRKVSKGLRINKHNGTIRYMSPEVLQGLDVGPKDDIYSLGITMWQLTTNSYPYSTLKSNDIVAYRVVKHQIRPDNQCFLEQQSVNKSNEWQENKFEHHQSSDCFKCSALNNCKYTEKLQNFYNLSKSPFKFKNNNLPKTPENPLRHQRSSPVYQHRKRSMTDETDVKQILLKIQSKQLNSKNKSNQTNLSQKNQFLIDCFEKNVQNENNLKLRLSDEFNNIYRTCWKVDHWNRPSANVLSEWFHKLLEKYKKM